jgi:DNA ligase D-like protein (predicted ligase)
MLATLTQERFSREGWIFEPKLDGERCLAFKRGKEVRLMSRNRKIISNSYPELVDALLSQNSRDFIVDGEVVAFNAGVTSFQRLQGRMQLRNADEARQSGIPVYYYIFDLIYLDGYVITDLELHSRKQLLHNAFTFKDPLRFTTHIDKEGEAYYKEACEKGWEGVIAKRADSTYDSVRSRDWLKFKCINEQEFIIGGYTDPQGQRIGFGALLIGYYEGYRLVYAGKVGTGYDEELLRRLSKELMGIQRDISPFSSDIKEKKVHWVSPKFVAEVGFTEWTRNGMLRHPRFLGLRRDKPAKQVIREG